MKNLRIFWNEWGVSLEEAGILVASGLLIMAPLAIRIILAAFGI